MLIIFITSFSPVSGALTDRAGCEVLGFNEALQKISPTVTEILEEHFRSETAACAFATRRGAGTDPAPRAISEKVWPPPRPSSPEE
jgi:hypothetical protein